MPVFIYQIAAFLEFNSWLSPPCKSHVSTHVGGVHHGETRERQCKDALVS